MNAFPFLCLSAVLAVSLAPILKADEPLPAGEKLEVVPKPAVEVRRPIAGAVQRAERGTILVRVADDGSLSDADFRPLDDDAALTAYLKEKKEALEAEDKEPQLVLRGERKVLYKHARDVIRKSTAAGVRRAVYSSIVRPTLVPANGELPDLGEHDRVIAITADGRITMNGEAMDSGPDDRALKRLVQKLQRDGKDHPDGPTGLKIWVLADNNDKDPRVIDVLNALSEAKIRSIRFDGGKN